MSSSNLTVICMCCAHPPHLVFERRSNKKSPPSSCPALVTLNAALGAFDPVQRVVIQGDSLAVIGVQMHGFNSFDGTGYLGISEKFPADLITHIT